MRRCGWVLAGTLGLALGAAPAVHAGDTLQRNTLRGLAGVQVRIGDLADDVERDGLAQADLQTDVEPRLRQYAVPVSYARQAAVLHAALTTLELDELGGYSFTASPHLTQWARLIGEPRTPFQAVTWTGRRVLGFTPTEKLSAVGRAVQDRVDEFIDAYLAVNPRR